MSSSTKKEKEDEKRKRQMQLLQNKHVRAVPGGYYTGLISDMHEDYRLFQERNIFTVIKSPPSQAHSSSPWIDHSHDEPFFEQRKLVDHLKTPLNFSVSSIQFTLPSPTSQLEHLSAIDFLIRFSHVSNHRKQIILKLLRKWPGDTLMEINELKEFLSEYLNHSRRKEEIDQYFDFLDLHAVPNYPLKSILIPLCVYSERYFLSRTPNGDQLIQNQRPLQELIDLEFLKRKLDGVHLKDSLRRLLETLQY